MDGSKVDDMGSGVPAHMPPGEERCFAIHQVACELLSAVDDEMAVSIVCTRGRKDLQRVARGDPNANQPLLSCWV
jgi:hypothetical protein